MIDEKRALRRAERDWRQSGLSVHSQVYTGLRNTFRKSRSQYYRFEMIGAGGNIRRIYQIANTLLGRDGGRPLLEDAAQASLAARVQISFFEKIDALGCNMTYPPINDVTTNMIALLVCSEVTSPTHTKNII